MKETDIARKVKEYEQEGDIMKLVEILKTPAIGSGQSEYL